MHSSVGMVQNWVIGEALNLRFLAIIQACSSVVRAFTHGVMGRWIDPSRVGHTELFLVLASAP